MVHPIRRSMTSGCIGVGLQQNLAVRSLTSWSRAVALALIYGQVHAEPLKRIEEQHFGSLPDGRPVKRFTLQNARGIVAAVIPYGATLTELQAPDRHGALTNVVLGAKTLEEYLKGV